MRLVSCDITINTSPGRITDAFIEEKMLKQWWGISRCLIEPQPGGTYTLAWDITENGIKYISTGVIKKYVPGKKLLIGDYIYLNAERPFLGPVNLVIEVSPGTETKLHLEQGPYPIGKGADWDWYYESVHNAWPKVLKTLKDYLE